MPPKKRKTTGKTTGKTAGGGGSSPQYIWLLKYDRRYESITGEALYSTKEKAIAALPHLMKAYTSCGDDWKNGLEGFGLEDEDPYLGFEYFGDSMGDEGGELLSNQNSDTRTKETVYLKLEAPAS
jgi:hypothetical protein